MASTSKQWKPDDDDSGHKAFLSNHTIFIHPAAMSQKRRGIMSNQIFKYGGREVLKLGDFEDSTSNDQMVLIDTSVIAKDKTAGIVAKCAHDMAGGVQILRMAWLSDSIRKEQALDFTKYHISHGHQTTPAALDTAVKDHDQTMEGPLPSKTFESKFVCAQSSGVSAGAQENLLHNERLIAELTKLAKAYKSTNDKWRFFGYEKAIAAIRRHPRDIKDPREATKIPGLGQKMADKIGEIIESGKLRKTAEVCDNEKTRTMALFTRIWGGGANNGRIILQSRL